MSESALLHWFATGAAAPPLVLLHGFTGRVTSWAPVVAALPESGAIAALALPGHHPAAAVAPGFEANVDQVAGQLEAAQLAGCHLVGYSLGARTALGLALQHPHLPAQLTLIGGHPGLATEAERDQRRAADEVWIELLRVQGIRAFVDAWEEHPIFATQEHLPAETRRRQRDMRLGHDAEGLARSLEHMGLAAMPDYGPRLGDLAMPVCLVAGARDPKFIDLARAVAARAPQARVELVADSGHNVPLECPSALANILSGRKV